MKRLLLLYLLSFLTFHFASATHNRAGEISIRQIGPLTIEATITTYTKASSSSVDRDSLTLEWGDGSKTVVARQNGPLSGGVGKGELLTNDIKKNIYVSVHTYPGADNFYVISMTDQNRNGGVKNINFPNSDVIAFSVSTTFTFLNQQFQGENSTPRLLQPPVDFGCVGEIFTHNPSAFDPDGDSLYYYMTVPRQSPGKPALGYVPPDKIGGSVINNALAINGKTGDLIWSTPQEVGEYNIAIMIVEYRNGVAIDSMIRDMQIFIQDKCQNKPPTLKIPKEICVVAGELIEFDVTGNDVDKGQKIKLTASGGPLSVGVSPAIFKAPSTFQSPTVKGTFRWQTTCEHISKQYYTVVFRAVDDIKITTVGGKSDTSGLATLQTWRVKVVAPAPEKLEASAIQGNINLSWEDPYACDDVSGKYFYGFSVWRRNAGLNLVRDTCAPGLTGKGYTKIGFRLTQSANGKYFFLDKNVERGKTYCYRVQAEFTKLTSAGNPYNLVEGLWSDEICAQLNRDVPLLVNVDVEKTDNAAGEIFVKWTKPNPNDLDTILNQPPYRYELQRTEASNSNFITVYTTTANSFATANDTIFTDKNSNTQSVKYIYRINFYVNNQTAPLAAAAKASSLFLNIAPTDRANLLSWNVDVPWQNTQYIIYKKNDLTGNFDSLTSVATNNYRDGNLTNGINYCYYIKSIGSYGIKGVASPLLNRSQIVCAIPIDNVPPCATSLKITNICTTNSPNTKDTTLVNNLSWRNPATICAEGADTKQYKIYYAKEKNTPLQLLTTINGAKDTTFAHTLVGSLTGCYHVTALDSLGNESKVSNTICVDNCPLYELPNTFTPNGDGQNDVFRPFPTFRFIAKIEMKIVNRWGNTVFSTTDPTINWDGKGLNGENLADGTYYYTCKVFEKRVEGVVPEEGARTGYITLLRGE
jgi:gliding motility-associated-like protein